jgi:hypothetical protein
MIRGFIDPTSKGVRRRSGNECDHERRDPKEHDPDVYEGDSFHRQVPGAPVGFDVDGRPSRSMSLPSGWLAVARPRGWPSGGTEVAALLV